jgi:uncharacterized membrane protein YidH (DUF202 family)
MSPDDRVESRPATVHDAGLQHERTALAWERTAIAGMVAGVLLARYTATELHPLVSAFGVLQVIVGSGVLVWAARHYDDLHGPLRKGQSPVHPLAARVVGLGAVAFSGIATVIAVIIALQA